MDCVVTGGNVKVLAKAIHSLSRIGDELYLEPEDDGLALRSVNSSRSAYACFQFAPLFFSRYTISRGYGFRCRVAIKSVQAVFRSLATLEKTVEKCHIKLDEEKNHLTFTLHCKQGLLKTHNLAFQDSESLQAVFDKESCPNVLRTQPRVLVDTVLNFPPSLEEVTVSVSDERVWFRNHVEEDTEQSRAMMTELCLASDEFDHFAVGTQTSITFCLKELRGLLVFAESTGLPISIYFDEPGSPVVLSVTDSVLEGNFVLATLSDDSNLRNSSKRSNTPPPPPDDFMNDDMDSYLIAMDTSSVAPAPPPVAPPSSPPPPSHTVLNQRPANQRTRPVAPPSSPPSSPPSPSHTLLNQRPANQRTRPHSEEDEEDEPVGTERPPNKKFRSLFFGSVFPTSPMANQTATGQDVLASDSEDDTQAGSP